MPLLGTLLAWIAGQFTSLFLLVKSTELATRIAGLLFVAGLYVSCVLVFTNVVSGWIGSVFSTSYGTLLGLLFLPVAGTVLASLALYWTSVIGYRYVSSLTRAVIK